MRIQSLLGRGAVAGCALALLPAPAALAATPAAAAESPTVVISTTPSAQVGGLPVSSLDGKIEYIPQREAATHGLKASAFAFASSSASGLDAAGPDTGYDISWPQCGGAMPSSSSIAIVGVDDGHPFSQNPCLQQEAAWASTAAKRAQYMVVDSPVGWSSPHVLEYAYHGPAGDCTATQYACQSYNWGYNAANADLQYATSQGLRAPRGGSTSNCPPRRASTRAVLTATRRTSGFATRR